MRVIAWKKENMTNKELYNVKKTRRQKKKGQMPHIILTAHSIDKSRLGIGQQKKITDIQGIAR